MVLDYHTKNLSVFTKLSHCVNSYSFAGPHTIKNFKKSKVALIIKTTFYPQANPAQVQHEHNFSVRREACWKHFFLMKDDEVILKIILL